VDVADYTGDHSGLQDVATSPSATSDSLFISYTKLRVVLVILLAVMVSFVVLTSPNTPSEVQTGVPTSQLLLTIDYDLLLQQVNPPEGFIIPVKLGQMGARLIEAGAIDYQQFAMLYQQTGQPLTEHQTTVLEGTYSEDSITIDSQNAHFWLNFFWAVGLTTQNPILTEGAMMQNGREGVVNFASTGGWILGAKPVDVLYASQPLIVLTPEQQARLEKVAREVYRPCCGNPTSFPDCNHGMAMLGLLELMASQNATEDMMFKTAKYVNAFWFPQQMVEVAAYLQVIQSQDFGSADPREVVGRNMFSSMGFKTIHQWLAVNKLLPEVGGGNSCGVK
jgi:hypothetical protein